MNYKLLILTASGLIWSGFAHSHHNSASHFILDQEANVEGVVTEYKLMNPHARIYLDVTNEDGEIEKWLITGDAGVVLRRLGWNEDEFKPGDHLKILGNPSRDGSPIMEWLTITQSDGATVGGGNGYKVERAAAVDNLEARRNARREAAAAKEMDPGQPKLDGTTWIHSLRTFEDPRWSIEDLLCGGCTPGALDYLTDMLNDPAYDDTSLNDMRMLVEMFRRKELAGMVSERAKSQAEGFDQRDDPLHDCEPIGFIRQVGGQPLPFRFKERDGRMIIEYEYWPNLTRNVYMDGRDHFKDFEPSLHGHSIGWYDGSEFVVETRGFMSNLWEVFLFDGLTNSEQAVVTERYSTSMDGEKLHFSIEVWDPRMLRKPYVSKNVWLLSDITEFNPPECEVSSHQY